MEVYNVATCIEVGGQHGQHDVIIILILVLLFFGGGYYGRGRWW